MSLSDSQHYENVVALIEDFAAEVDIHKDIFQRTLAEQEPHCSVCVFYASPDQKDYLIVIPSQSNFSELLPKISEALHFYSARKSHVVLITVISKIAVDDIIYDSINFFVASPYSAYVYYLPYTVEDNVAVWHDNIAFIDVLATAEMDQNGADFVNLVHAHVHVDGAAFEPAEILNYLSYQGFAIQSLNPANVVSYIDMSTFEYPHVHL